MSELPQRAVERTAVLPASESGAAVLRTLLLTDLVDSTRLVEKLGDARAAEVSARHDRVARDLLPAFQGLEIDKTDGFLLLFERPFDAVGYALAYHRALAELSVELGVQLRARAGIHLGEVFLRENPPEDVARGAKPLEVEGLAKPVAARVMSLAGGKQTLMTEGAFNLARQAAGSGEPADAVHHNLVWLAHGTYRFQGVAEPVDLFEVGIPDLSLLEVPLDTAKAKRAVAEGEEVTLGWRPGAGLEIPRRSGWLLERRLGAGGFGEVWLAVNQTIGEERVFKFCYDADRLHSLKREVTLFRLLRETLGRRPEVMRILDWSFDEAPYFLEVEYVAGGDLVDWTQARGGLTAVPLKQRLEIVAQVADALAAAHSVGVLHRDVKPRNVLIAQTNGSGGSPRAKLGDFGISEVDESTLVARGITVMGLTELSTPGSETSRGGTHLYIAPEVAEGRPATVQADLYALGLMLYQMVAGDFQRTLGQGWRRDVDDDLLAEDIAAFVDREPERRPASAREVAERLRSLEQRREEREAEQRSRQEAEAARLALARAHRRRKVAAVIAVAAVVVLVVVSVLAIQAVRARDQAKKAQGIADSRREQAEGLIGFMLGDLRSKLAPVGRLDIVDDVGDRALEYFAAVPEGDVSDAELLGRSRALYQIGDVRIAQGKLEQAQGPLEESLDLAGTLVERRPDDGERLFELGQAHFWVGYVHWRRRDLAAALGQFQAYLDLSERLVSLDPENLDWRLELAAAHSNIGSVLQEQGDYPEALERFEACLAIEKALVGEDPDNQDWRRAMAASHNAIGVVLKAQGKLRESLVQHQTELSLQQALAAEAPENMTWRRYLAVSHNHVGASLEALGRSTAALEQLQSSELLLKKLVERDPTHMPWQRDLAIQDAHISTLLRAFGDLDAALEYARQAVQRMAAVVATDPSDSGWRRDLADARIVLGSAQAARNNLRSARRSTDSALELVEDLLDEDPEDHQSLRLQSLGLELLGGILARQGDLSTAQEAWERALAAIAPVARDAGDVEFLVPWARILLHLDQGEEAGSVVEKIHAMGYQGADFVQFVHSKGLPFSGDARNTSPPTEKE